MTAVADALARLAALHPKLIDLSLDRVWRLLGDLGNPQERLPPVIHVAGTNGKGSVVAFLRAFLEAGGLRVHVYTSPHLVRFNERIRLAGAEIGDQALADLLGAVEAANAGQPVTVFEITTCAALKAFAETPADVVILETGLGGRLDATNVVKAPVLSVLTPIGKDHEQFLGGHLEAIAAEKAHILKPGTPCVVAKQERAVAQIIELRSLEVGAPTILEGKDFHAYTRKDGGLDFQGRSHAWSLPTPALVGAHQIHNAALALAGVEVLLPRFPVPPAALALGMKSVAWPARLQRLTRGPLVEALPEGWELWLDGAHNPHAARMLATFLRGWKDMPLDMVCGMMGPKDARGFFAPLAARLRRLRTVAVEGEMAGKPPEAVAEAARAEGVVDVAVCADVEAAVRGLLDTAGPPRRILIAGSLYLVGQVLQHNG